MSLAQQPPISPLHINLEDASQLSEGLRISGEVHMVVDVPDSPELINLIFEEEPIVEQQEELL